MSSGDVSMVCRHVHTVETELISGMLRGSFDQMSNALLQQGSPQVWFGSVSTDFQQAAGGSFPQISNALFQHSSSQVCLQAPRLTER